MSVFANPPHETRFGYAAIRPDSGVFEKQVVEVTYLPPSKKSPVIKSIASDEFLRIAGEDGNTIEKPAGKLIKANFGRWGGENLNAKQMAGLLPSNSPPVRGPFYWLDIAPKAETWWRWSVPLDFEKMPGVKSGAGGKRQDFMRLTIAQQISDGIVTGPFFVETVWNLSHGNRYWFDIYARRENDLLGIKLLLG